MNQQATAIETTLKPEMQLQEDPWINPDAINARSSMMLITGSLYNFLPTGPIHVYFEAIRQILGCQDLQILRDGDIFSFLVEWGITLGSFSGMSDTMRSLMETRSYPFWSLQHRLRPSDVISVVSRYDLWGCTLSDLWFVGRVAGFLMEKCGPVWNREKAHEASKLDDYLSGILQRGQGPSGCWTQKSSEINHDHERFSQAYRCASLIHLRRRGIGTPSSAATVQDLVTKILDIVKHYTSIAAVSNDITKLALTFPLVTAGFEVQNQAHKDFVLLQCRSWNSTGVMHVRLAV